MKARWAAAILDAMEDIQKNMSKLTTPYLLIYGDGDYVVQIESLHYLYDNSPSTDKAFKVIMQT